VRIKRSDFNRLIEEGYSAQRSGDRASVNPGIWEGEIPPPDEGG
jgi:hypothetical protein